MITKALVGAAIALGTAVGGLAAPAGADPSAFNVLSCSCPQTVPKGSVPVSDQMDKGIEAGLTYLQGIQAPR